MDEYGKYYESKKQDAFHRKKELDKLRVKEMEIKEKVTATTVVRKDELCFSSLTRAPPCTLPLL